MQEYSALKMLSSMALDVDASCTIQFAARKDARDGRPLNYRAQILSGSNQPYEEWLFRSCGVVKDGRTAPAEQLAASSMQFVEDMDPKALPSTTDGDALVAGARKFEQIGKDAFVKIFDGLLENVKLEGKAGVLFVDLHLGVGDSFMAWLSKRSSLNVPSGFFGFTDDGIVQEWFNKSKSEEIASMHLEGGLVIPGFPHIPKDVPQDRVRDAVPAPKMNVLVAGGPDKSYPVFPDAMVKEFFFCCCFKKKFG